VKSLIRRLVEPYVRGGVRRARRTLAGEEILRLDRIATSFGVESAGVWQLRGSGCLAASPTRLVFCLWRPRRTLVIDRARILAVETTRSHLGKSVLRRLLRVRFTRDDGREDAVAWAVAELEPWLELLGTPPGGAGAPPAA
jgi:hypothetical protein